MDGVFPLGRLVQGEQCHGAMHPADRFVDASDGKNARKTLHTDESDNVPRPAAQRPAYVIPIFTRDAARDSFAMWPLAALSSQTDAKPTGS